MSLSTSQPASSSQRHTLGSGMLSNQDLEILWVARTLTNIDAQCENELSRLERSDIPEKLKSFVKHVILSKYREKRAPYDNLLERLKKQQHS